LLFLLLLLLLLLLPKRLLLPLLLLLLLLLLPLLQLQLLPLLLPLPLSLLQPLPLPLLPPLLLLLLLPLLPLLLLLLLLLPYHNRIFDCYCRPATTRKHGTGCCNRRIASRDRLDHRQCAPALLAVARGIVRPEGAGAINWGRLPLQYCDSSA
jgi:hypothetical protein